jgi:uncharacterized protein with ATP-grasp and redox domains
VSERNPIKYFEIDFDTLDTCLKDVHKVYPDEDALRKAAKQLIQIIQHEYKSKDQSKQAALMVWRGMLMIMQLE